MKNSEKHYHVRKEITLASVCGEYLLIATEKARKECPRVRLINETGARIWKMLEEESSLTDIIEEFREEYPETDKEQLRKDAERFIQCLAQAGYLLEK